MGKSNAVQYAPKEAKSLGKGPTQEIQGGGVFAEFDEGFDEAGGVGGVFGHQLGGNPEVALAHRLFDRVIGKHHQGYANFVDGAYAFFRKVLDEFRGGHAVALLCVVIHG